MRTPTTPTTRAPRDRCATRSPRRSTMVRSRGLAVTPRRIQVELTPQAVERVAQRVVQLLRNDKPHGGEPELITAGELAHRLRVQRSWIYKHRHLLGGERIGDGPKAPWRFDLEVARRAMKYHQAAQHANGGL
jgi:hypothetical protein